MKKGIDGFKEDMQKLVQNEYSVLESIYDKKKKLTTYKVKHNKCGREYITTRTKFVKRGDRCRDCSVYSKKDSQWFRDIILEKTGDEYLLIGEYLGSRVKTTVKHTKCGTEYLVTPNKFITGGNRCPKCSHPSVMKTTEEFKDEINNLLGNSFELIGDYRGRKENIKIFHKKCGNTFEIKAGDLLRYPSCRICQKYRSRGESYIRSELEKNKITFKEQFRIKECRDKRPLPFDFAVFDSENNLLTLIEYNGRQHYTKGSLFTEDFDDRQKKDSIKINYCKENNIDLLIIPYTSFEDIPNIIKQLANKKSR